MDRSIEWPWSSEEVAEWKADLEERDYDFLQELIDRTVEGAGSSYVLGPPQVDEPAEDAQEKYSVTA
ncbi:MAG: hypothetical protein WAK89_00585 [Candidatus Sulfotelmatobacter sp.]